jgi:predicted AAA+ superfamily ATPase
MLGRYHYYRLHPFSLTEIGLEPSHLADLIKFGGFPEPLLSRDPRGLRRWHQQRVDRLIRGDLQDLETVKDIEKLHQLAEALPGRVGSPLSIKSLSQDLEVDFKTMKRWLSILDLLYYSYQIPPYGSSKIRAVKKEQKLYLWDWSQIESPGHRFENFVGSQLLKFCHYHEDVNGYRMELRFIRDTDKREIDFVVIQDKKPPFAVECKSGDSAPSPHLFYFRDRTPIPKFYQVHLGTRSRQVDEQISILSYIDFCKEVGLV